MSTGRPVLPPWETAIRELIKGRDLTSHLGSLLVQGGNKKPKIADCSSLVGEILGSCSRALIALDSVAKAEHHRQSNDEKKENECTNKKIPSLRRGGYRRRRIQPYSSTKITTKKIEDGYTWRKYGQKEILNAKFPRSYFRCTRKHDLGCLATKHVQQSEDDPSTYMVTYTGEHTCRDPREAAAFLQRESCNIISFGSAGTFPNLKQLEYCEEEEEGEVISNINTPGNSSTDTVPWLESGASEGSVQVAAEVVERSSDQHDVTSGLQSSADILDLGLMEDSFMSFNDYLCFDDQDDFPY